jgi:trehalose/maltose hydrolase-like predicted phosphorylase
LTLAVRRRSTVHPADTRSRRDSPTTRPEAFTAEQKARNFAFYERITVRDSSLSAAAQAVLAAETGHLALAYDYLCETALLDLGDLAGNTEQGLHIAALAGAWSGVVAGFGGPILDTVEPVYQPPGREPLARRAAAGRP